MYKRQSWLQLASLLNLSPDDGRVYTELHPSVVQARAEQAFRITERHEWTLFLFYLVDDRMENLFFFHPQRWVRSEQLHNPIKVCSNNEKKVIAVERLSNLLFPGLRDARAVAGTIELGTNTPRVSSTDNFTRDQISEYHPIIVTLVLLLRSFFAPSRCSISWFTFLR